MKHGSDLTFATIVVIIIGLIIGGTSFQKKEKPKPVSPSGKSYQAEGVKPTFSKDTTVAPKPGTYTVTLPMDEWIRMANGMQYATAKIRYSDLPSKEVSLIIDSIFTPILAQLQNQIPPQVQAEEKAKADAQKKVDSTGNKKKN